MPLSEVRIVLEVSHGYNHNPMFCKIMQSVIIWLPKGVASLDDALIRKT